VTMDKFVIEGRAQLSGTVHVEGSKNASLPILAATVLSSGTCTIRNVPDIWDVATLSRILTEVGMEVSRDDHTITVAASDLSKCVAPYDLVRKMRASFFLLGPLLAGRGRAKVSYPGGCVLGPRPVNLHVKGLRMLGADVQLDHGYVTAKADKLKGAEIYLGGPNGPTAGGTYNIMMAATLAEGTTVIEGASCEPEVEELANFLKKMGARISGAGTHRIVIEGVSSLAGADHTVMPDRMNAATFIFAGAITGSSISVRGLVHSHLAAVVDKLNQIRVNLEKLPDGYRVLPTEKLLPADVITQPYPGFQTDTQPPLCSLLALADGISIVTERIFEERFTHVSELARMGASIRVQGSSLIIEGVPELSGAPVMASDLRGGAALVLAGLAATGVTEVNRVYHIDRGYERLDERLNQLGAKIRRVPV
jgi:UDP-N-acetylglucosamine 1-carboxyvinyltransferase